jgi:hypothetical protein
MLYTLPDLDYIQPKIANTHLASVAVVPPMALVVVEPDNEDNAELLLYASHFPKKPPCPLTPLYDLTNLPPPAYSVSLKDLDQAKLIQWLY